MKHLLEVAQIVTKKKVKKIEIFDDYSLQQKSNKFNDFYQSIMAGKFKTDQDAATYLYGCSPTDDKYRQLKSRFKKRLLNTLFFLDINQPATSNYNRAYYSCNKDWTLVKILLSNKAYHTAAHLARHVLTVSLKFKFADLIVNCARILREYTTMFVDEKKYEEYDQYCKQYQNVLAAEIRSEELYQRVVINYFKPLSKKTDLRQKIDTYCEALQGLSAVYNSPIIICNHFMVWAYRYEMLSDYEKLLEQCIAAEQYIKANPKYYRDDKLADFGIKKLTALLHLKRYEEGKETANHYATLFEKSELWFDFKEYLLIIALHTEHYQTAIDTYFEVANDSKFKKLGSEELEIWQVYEVYVHYLMQIYELKPTQTYTRRRKQFRLKRFLLEPVLYPKPKRILSIMMVTIQVFFLLEEGRYGEAFERIERLKGYATQQLKKDEYYRAIQFIRLLQQLAKADFNYENIGVHQKYLDRLQETAFRYRGLLSELEILPYEKLWSVLLERLKPENVD